MYKKINKNSSQNGFNRSRQGEEGSRFKKQQSNAVIDEKMAIALYK